MERYVAVDSGKFATKLAWANEDLTAVQKCQFRTKMGHGNMLDDEIGRGTYVVQIGEEVYKIGNAASTAAELVTSKKSEIHRNCTILALALIASENETDEFHVAIGTPIDDYLAVERRLEYRDFILPEGEMTVLYKTQKSDIVKKTFKIVKRYVYPESAGGLYLDAVKNRTTAAIIDIGSLNVSETLYQGFEPDREHSITGELGGQILIRNLASELSSQLGMRCDETLVSEVLRGPLELRFLTPNVPNAEIEDLSRDIINDYMLRHTREIKRLADSKRWSLDFIPLTFIGGTSAILAPEIRQVFGDTVTIAEYPEFVNALGFLYRMVAYETDKLLPLDTNAASRLTA